MTESLTSDQSPGNGVARDPVPVPTAGPPVGTDFKPVATGTGANVEAFPAYFTDPLLGTGNLPGIAISSFNNRALRQGTFVASSLCLWISGQIQAYIPDDGDQIHWQSEWQNALSNFVASLIPPGPDLGAYLPLAGGQMGGNITFQPGITTVLANNTYYQALDSGGQARGLIIKNSNNDITINDGTAVHVTIANIPVANNNYAWSGKNTTGTILPVIGLMSDNNIHIGGTGITDIYFDETTAVHHAGNFILANNKGIYGLDTGGTARALVSVGTDNAAYFGSGITGNTNIYSGTGASNWIYLRTQTNALSTLTVNGYTYMNGRGRAYIPGGNDPFQVYSDNGYYARIQHIVAGVRQWSAGVLNSGLYAVSDDSAGAYRFQIDTGGTATFFNTCNINGSSTVGGNLQCNNSINANGNLSCSNTGYVYNQLQVWNSIVIQSGALYVQGGGISANGGITGNPVNSNGDMNAQGNLWCGNTITSNVMNCNGGTCNGNYTVGNQLQVNGGILIPANYGASVNTTISPVGGSFWGVYTNTDFKINPPSGGIVNAGNDSGYVGQSSSQFAIMWCYNYANVSDPRVKKDIADPEAGALDQVLRLRPKQYRWNHEADESVAPLRQSGGLNRGFMADEVREVMGEEFAGVVSDNKSDLLGLDYNQLIPVLWQAVQELSQRVVGLSDELKQLKAA